MNDELITDEDRVQAVRRAIRDALRSREDLLAMRAMDWMTPKAEKAKRKRLAREVAVLKSALAKI